VPSSLQVAWDERIVALQSRILYTSEQLRAFRQHRSDESWEALTRILTDELSKMEVVVPTLDQVEDTMAGLQWNRTT
jgi:hypothetical protein